jgi:hypothetical protein
MNDYKKLVEIIKEAFAKEDPAMLLEMGAPADEYDEEVFAIASKISDNHNVDNINEVINKVMNKSFSKDTAVRADSCLKIANLIYSHLHNR